MQRYHGLDGLRGTAMLLGIVIHGSLPYFSRIVGIEAIWPADDDQSIFLLLVFDFIHSWRMPVFFLMAGFFAHLVLDRRPTPAFIFDRLRRIALPLVFFGAVMAILVPTIWVYGWYGAMSWEIFQDVMRDRKSLGSSGDIVAHLWFLYYLLLMYAALIAIRSLPKLRPVRAILQAADRVSIGRRLGNAIYTRIPLLLMLGAVILLVLRAGDESKPVWPLNLVDVFYAGLFFFYGYGLYIRREFIDRIKRPETMVTLWVMAAFAFWVHVVLSGAVDDATRQDAGEEAVAFLWLIRTVFYGSAAALFCIGLVGLFESLLSSPRVWIRWLADSSYWIYIIHLPLVAFITFYLAHLDRQGRLQELTGLSWGAEAKFLAACVATCILGMLTYRYLVRYTRLGVLLNGQRSKSPL